MLLMASSCRKKDIPDGEKPIDELTAEITETGLITFSPAFPDDSKPVKINFDASKGNGGLKDQAGDVYMHTGVITDKSTSPSDWKYVKSSSFNVPDPAVKMTAKGNNLYTIEITPRTFYKVPAGEKILKLAVLFRNADGSKVGRNKDNSDIYLPLFSTEGLNVRFKFPEFEPGYQLKPVINVQLVGDELTVSAICSKTANLSLSLNGSTLQRLTMQLL